jgi:hypothetical protein
MTYPKMIDDRFMSEIANFQRLTLGHAEKKFLAHILIASFSEETAYSAYGLYSFLNKNYRPITYKNVHKVVKKLESLGLIREIKGKFKRNAIKYEATTKGLFEYFLSVSLVEGLLNVVTTYNKNIILQTLLYPFFEFKTINEFVTIESVSILKLYLRSCSEKILKSIEEFRENSEYYTWIQQKELLDFYIKKEVTKFILEILSSTDILGETESTTTIFPEVALRMDKKFLALVRELKGDLDRGFAKYLL